MVKQLILVYGREICYLLVVGLGGYLLLIESFAYEKEGLKKKQTLNGLRKLSKVKNYETKPFFDSHRSHKILSGIV